MTERWGPVRELMSDLDSAEKERYLCAKMTCLRGCTPGPECRQSIHFQSDGFLRCQQENPEAANVAFFIGFLCFCGRLGPRIRKTCGADGLAEGFRVEAVVPYAFGIVMKGASILVQVCQSQKTSWSKQAVETCQKGRQILNVVQGHGTDNQMERAGEGYIRAEVEKIGSDIGQFKGLDLFPQDIQHARGSVDACNGPDKWLEFQSEQPRTTSEIHGIHV